MVAKVDFSDIHIDDKYYFPPARMQKKLSRCVCVTDFNKGRWAAFQELYLDVVLLLNHSHSTNAKKGRILYHSSPQRTQNCMEKVSKCINPTFSSDTINPLINSERTLWMVA